MRQKARKTGHETPAEGRYRRLFAERRKGEPWAALAARAGVAPGTLSWWRRRDAARKRSGGEGPTLLPVRAVASAALALPPPALPPETHGYEVVLAGGRRDLRVRRPAARTRTGRSEGQPRCA